MSERKVLNKYYPPDFDPSKIPRMKLAKNRQYTVRLMAPFNMRCKTCGEYIYKGKKFNARKEDVEGEDYIGIRIYRFYIKCTRCLQEISFKTDPKNTDYEIEAGATRNFMALKLAEEQAKREEDEEKEDEATNPMKVLEKRTQQSKQELDLIESLEELKDLNRRQQTINYEQMLGQYDTTAAKLRTLKEQEEHDEQLVKEMLRKRKLSGKVTVVEEEIIELDGKGDEPPKKEKKIQKGKKHNHEVAEETGIENALEVQMLKDNKVENDPFLEPSTNANKKKFSLSNLVKVNVKPKPNESETKEKNNQPTSSSEKKNEIHNVVNVDQEKLNCSEVKKPSGLSLLGAYSDSDSD